MYCFPNWPNQKNNLDSFKKNIFFSDPAEEDSNFWHWTTASIFVLTAQWSGKCRNALLKKNVQMLLWTVEIILPKPPKIVPSAGDQSFKCLWQWRTFLLGTVPYTLFFLLFHSSELWKWMILPTVWTYVITKLGKQQEPESGSSQGQIGAISFAAYGQCYYMSHIARHGTNISRKNSGVYDAKLRFWHCWMYHGRCAESVQSLSNHNHPPQVR